MFKIGEFSKLTQVSIRMLRYYDENNLLHPDHTDPENGYRFYSVEQIPTLNRIIFLRDLGFNIHEISDALLNWNDASMHLLLEKKRLEIQHTIENEKEKLAKIQLARQDINQKQMDIHYNVIIKPVTSEFVISLRRVVPDYYAEGDLWKELATYIQGYKIDNSTQTFSIYHDTDFREANVDVELCVPISVSSHQKIEKIIKTNEADTIEGLSFRYTEAVPFIASAMVYGPFENISGAFHSVADWLSKHNQYRMTGLSRQIVHRGPWNESDPQNYLIEIQLPLNKITS